MNLKIWLCDRNSGGSAVWKRGGGTADQRASRGTLKRNQKQEVQALEQKVDALDANKRAKQQQKSAIRASPGILDQKVRILERQRELDQQAASEAAEAEPKITLVTNGFSFVRETSNFIASLHGMIQVDSRTFLADGGGTAGKDTFLLRRARPIFTRTIHHEDFNFTPDFGGSGVVVYDASNYHYSPAFQLEGGRFESPVRA